jgi:hypothetical protein
MQHLHDGGCYYAETNLANFIVEPWNAITSLFFLILAIYWFIRIRRNVKDNLFIAWCIPLLFLGGMGSTLFHAFRSSYYLMQLDVLPIVVLTLSVGAFLWHKLVKKWYITFAIIALSFTLRKLASVSGLFPGQGANISYAISGITIFLPGLIMLLRTQFYRWASLAAAVMLFIAGLFFRAADMWYTDIIPIGTHFMWHISTAVGAYFLADYLYHLHHFTREQPGEAVLIRVPSGNKRNKI